MRPALGAMVMVAAAASVWASDSRGSVELRWTAPNNQGVAASSYRLRLSQTPPGGDLESWWDSAVPQWGLPIPGQPGSTETWSGSLPVGETTWIGIKSSDAENDWSTITHTASITTYATPFVQGVAPHHVTSGTLTTFVLSGLGMSEVTDVQFEGGGTTVNGWGLTILNSEMLEVSVTLPSNATQVDVLVTAPGGTDRLKGWIMAAQPQQAPPNTITDLTALALDHERARLSWTAPSDDLPVPGTPVESYKLRRLGGSPGNWDWDTGQEYPAPNPSGPGTSETFLIAGLPPGQTYAFALKSMDAAGTWSQMSNVAVVTLPDAPVVYDPPARIVDLEIVPSGPGTEATLSWSAPQDPTGPKADAYLIRMMVGPDPTWEQGQTLPSENPSTPGTQELLDIPGLTPGSYLTFGIRTRGTTGEWSDISNLASVILPGDDLAPEGVEDLAASLQGNEVVLLSWTAGLEADVSRYEIRRSDSDLFLWESSTLVTELGAENPGEQMSLEVASVEAGSVGHWALVVKDHTGNTSAVSNVAMMDRRNVDFTAPELSGVLDATQDRNSRVQLRWRAGGDDGQQGRADHYELAVIQDPDIFSEWWLSEPPSVLSQRPKTSGKREFHNLKDVFSGGSVYGLAISAVDEVGLHSQWLYVLVMMEGGVPADASPPAAPEGVTAYRGEYGATVSWSPSPEADVSDYRIYEKWNGEVTHLASVPAGIHQYAVPSGVPLGEVEYSVTSVDQSGNESVIAMWEILQDLPQAPVVLLTSQGWELRIPGGPENLSEPQVAVYDVQGRLVGYPDVIQDGPVWRASWNGESRFGTSLAAGVYFMRTSHQGSVHTTKLILRP